MAMKLRNLLKNSFKITRTFLKCRTVTMTNFSKLNSKFYNLKYLSKAVISRANSSISLSRLTAVSCSSWTWKLTKMHKSIKLCINFRIFHWMAPIKKFLCKWNNINSYTFKTVILIFPISRSIPSLLDKIIVSLICPHNLINKILARE